MFVLACSCYSLSLCVWEREFLWISPLSLFISAAIQFTHFSVNLGSEFLPFFKRQTEKRHTEIRLRFLSFLQQCFKCSKNFEHLFFLFIAFVQEKLMEAVLFFLQIVSKKSLRKKSDFYSHKICAQSKTISNTRPRR